MKKIAIISASYFPNIWNSHGRSTFSIAYGLASKGYDVSVFTFTDKRETFKQQDGQVSIYFVGGSYLGTEKITSLPFESIDAWNERLLPLLLCEKFDTIILNSWHGWEAAKKYQTAKIISFIPQLYSFTGWLKPLPFGLEQSIKTIESECITHSDVLVAHTEKFATKLASYCNREVYVVPNCHLDMSNSGAKEKVKIKNQICFVGRVNREKCLERIIRVLPELPEANLVVASLEKNQGYFSTLEKLAKALDVEHKIKFLNWISTRDVRELYKESSLAIVTSQFEPYGYSALDPMAIGTEVIVSEWSCLGEYLGQEDHVFSKLKTFQEKIADSLANTDTATIQASKDRIKHHYSEPHITNLIEQVL